MSLVDITSLQDHPRRCGENLRAWSSPPSPCGITPAGAGKTVCTTTHTPVQWDHPRRCGENAPFLRRTVRRPGSPPQVRGKPPYSFFCNTHSRITPAGAGKTVCAQLFKLRIMDHPRRCGENPLAAVQMTAQSGSPPQVRGKRSRTQTDTQQIRITPAGAGKTVNRFCICFFLWDHPRRCGENLKDLSAIGHTTGSPPQVRGKPQICIHKLLLKRITPAGAGKTYPVRQKHQSIRDHPRRCGENVCYPFLRFTIKGSPPQVRGKP